MQCKTPNASARKRTLQSGRQTYCKNRRVFPIGRQYPRSLDPACRFRWRLRYRSQLRRIRAPERQFNRPPPRCPKTRDESPAYDNFYGIGRLVKRSLARPAHLGRHSRRIRGAMLRME